MGTEVVVFLRKCSFRITVGYLVCLAEKGKPESKGKPEATSLMFSESRTNSDNHWSCLLNAKGPISKGL